MHKFLVFFACFSLQALVGSGSPLINALESNGGHKYYAGLQPYATDYGANVTEALNLLLTAILSKPLPVITPDPINSPVAPIEVDLAIISGGSLTGSLSITELSINASLVHVNETRALVDEDQNRIDVYLGLAVPLQISGTLALDASFAGIKIKSTGGYKVSLEDLFLGIVDTVILECAFTEVDYRLLVGGVVVALDNVKIAGLDATTLFNELVSQVLTVQIIPALLKIETTIHPVITPVLQQILDTFVPILVPGCDQPRRELPQIASEMLKKLTSR